jgi:hypothetical protein
MPPYRPWTERFWEKVALPNENGCMLWLAYVNPKTGYGDLRMEPKTVLAHRLSYELAHGPIPEGLQIDHLCRVRACVAPGHLEAVTSQVNNLRSTCYEKKRAKTHCKRGHARTGDNVIVTKQGHRICRACVKDNSHRAYIKRRDAERADQRTGPVQEAA